MKQLTELDRYILKQEFPQISLTEDPDIERYFEFRSLNRQAEALRLYNTKLLQRYPNDKIRVLLMTYYRKHDARFRILLTDSLAQLADKTIGQVKKIIIFFTATIAPLKNAKVYTIIQVCEKVIGAISPDRFAAIGFSEKYVRYAERLNYHADDMRQAADIIRMYITDTISSVREFREERKRETIQERNRITARQMQNSVVDFSRITFTKQQVSAITIASSIIRIEDKVLAYTVKYWDRYTDGAFENTLLLYSRKYGTNHYAIFQAIKIGRVRKWKDEELLHSVLANVAQGYYYSISGDLYLQRTWKQVKLKLEAAPQGDSQNQTAKGTKPPQKAAQARQAKKLPQSSSKVNNPLKKAPAIKAVPKVKAIPVIPERKQAVLAAEAAAAGPVKVPVSVQPAPLQSDAIQDGKNRRQALPAKQSSSLPIYPITTQKEQPLSIADTVKRITGKSYSIYRDLFFKEVRSSIRVILQHSAVQKLSFFGNEQNNAENIIYQFLESNYDNPYQQWQDSQAQSEVLAQGFRIDNLEPIIRHWAKHNL